MRIPGFDEEGEFFLGFSDEDFVFPCFAEREEKRRNLDVRREAGSSQGGLGER